MEAEHVATTMLVLQYLVQAQRNRQARQSLHHHQQSVHGRVTASREVFSQTAPAAADSDGPIKQMLGQMMGELGAMIWQMMADFTGPDLAKANDHLHAKAELPKRQHLLQLVAGLAAELVGRLRELEVAQLQAEA
eukprot:gene1087-1423_t